ncbi:type VII secretion protein EccB [Asanoa ferruginea]|uniref:Type VII secretion protein EccB n=1 Tax=Asanoa ferruginea TaxID=53367 RepID=A0A3D9ZGW5_9ACTN|nr:type VII secretion protein EccB [Asanoa ferruginea]REF95744.1 type VII secretion protein EccB [Asanoa ferruginea]GIF53279.1 type VII secretion protein EccB [Asanoa ferruginea]
MPSRQDQLHSYQFMVQRVVSALVMRETDPAQPPFRRAAGASLAGVLVAAIIWGGFVVYGVLVDGGGTAWRDTSAVIVERESGARYIYRDGKLHLVVNYSSALLAVGAPQPKTVLVSRRSIEGVPRGSTLGIAEAPDSLPAAGRLLGPPWTVCTLPGPASVVLVGATSTGGTRVGERGVLAQHPDGSLHLIWQNHRYRLSDPSLALTALGWTTVRPVAVAPALLGALPAGPDLAVPRISGRSTRVPSARIGEVFVVTSQGGGRQYAVAVRAGLAGITQVQADLLLTANRQDGPTELTQGRFASIEKAPDLVPADLVPTVTPSLVGAFTGALCAVVRDDRGVADVVVDADLPDVADAARTRDGAADYVAVPPGRAAVVEAVAAPGATGGTVSVVTDLGRRHAVVGADTLAMLGYGDVRPVRLPAAVVALLGSGASLDPARAQDPV